MLTRTALEALTQRPPAFLRSAWPWRSLAYLLAGAAPGLVVFAVVANGVLFRLPLVVIAVVLAVVVLGKPLVTRFERLRLRLVDGAPLPETPDRGRREMVLTLVTVFGLWWIDLVVVGFTTGGPVVLILSPVVQPDTTGLVAGVAALAGVLLLPVAAYTITAWAGARGAMVRAMLAPPELNEVLRSRARLVDAFEAERRRIERDLHDGAQQRLVALSMTLGLARLDLAADDPAGKLIERAHDQAKQALAELRELIRGVHPQVLTDRGLPAAVRDLAGRSPLPVDVHIDLTPHPPVRKKPSSNKPAPGRAASGELSPEELASGGSVFGESASGRAASEESVSGELSPEEPAFGGSASGGPALQKAVPEKPDTDLTRRSPARVGGAGNSPAPVGGDSPVRLPVAVEATAYYVVAEALANVAKHARATKVTINGHLEKDRLVVEIHDDGCGGADPARGTGLTGLADRLAVVGGRLSLSSPVGGPTLMRVEIPCA
ncbi:histidine kinase [Nonomuraea sp. NEAU-A123]|uniref:histidine kinase n=1 Tax=Nonomuraea sp. NEAU-A123 TaxID=2839649 RepID=UPI0027E01B72|nr:histidine kinase [Nonomuraea sp. NEAU-A123]